MAKFMWKNDLGGPPSSRESLLTDSQVYVIQVVSVTCSSVSLALAILSIYWFTNMRRSFRHDLIMFLIQSDMLKSLSFLIYGIVSLRPGSTVESSSTFCQVSGFFTALAIEASDFAVLIIAIHSALYIFKPPASIGEGGLYPYRHIAFIFWIVFPTLMASLAFTNPGGAYIAGGSSCYLPVRPFWYRLALSWVPRYLIFVAILSVDASIYFYVRYMLRNFKKRGDTPEQPIESQDSAEQGGRADGPARPLKKYGLPPTPPLAYNGLMPATRPNSVGSPEARKRSVSITDLNKYLCTKADGAPRLKWTSLSFPRQAPKKAKDSTLPISEPATNAAASLPMPDIKTSPAAILTPVSGLPPSTHTSWTTFAARFNSHPPSRISFRSFLRLQPSNPSEASTPLSQLKLVNSRGQSLVHISMLQRRDKIRNQLRFLFIYPLVYMGMWILPFVNHALQYDDTFAVNPPYALSVIVTAIVSSQCAVDCLVFTSREKPWKHFSAQKRNFRERFSFWHVFCTRWGRRMSHSSSRSGKRRAEMVAEARMAYRRRDNENAARASEMESRGRSERGERSWWDELESGDGTTHPLESDLVRPLEGQGALMDDVGCASGEGEQGFETNKVGCNVV